MTESDVVPKTYNSFLSQICSKFEQTEAEDVIHELKRLYPTRKESFDEYNLYGAFKELYVLGAIDDNDGDQNLLQTLAEKTSKKDEILNLISCYKKNSSSRKDDFVGREDDVSGILKLVRNRRVPGMNVFGDSGLGKTTLAKEVSKRLESFETMFIDLREIKSLDTAYFLILQKVNLPAWDDNKRERIYQHLQTLDKKTVLILDSVEQFLSKESQDEQETRADFLEFLKAVIGSEASQQGFLKVILTSTTQLNNSELRRKWFTEYNVRPFSRDVSKDFLSKRVKVDVSDSEQDEAMCKIADLCRNNPCLLQGAEQLLRKRFTTPKDVLRQITAQIEKGVPEQFACISALFDSLPSDHLRHVALKISLLRRPFSASTAMKIAEISSFYDAELDLEMLAIHKIITAEDSSEKEKETTQMKKKKYGLHALFRDFLTSHFCKEDHAYKEQLKRGEKQFYEHFSGKLTKLANNLEREFVNTYSKLEGNKANFELAIELSEENKETLDLLLHTDDHNQFALMGILFEVLKDEKERRELFGKWAEAAEKQGQWFNSALMRCWQSIQGYDLEGTLNEEMLEKAKTSLEKLQSTSPEKLNEVKSLFLYCQGKIKWMKAKRMTLGQRTKEREEKLLKEGIEHFKQSLEMRKQMNGDSTLTARALNLIGNCYMGLENPSEAKKHYEQAMDMKIRLVGSEKHWEIPTYYNQMAQIHDMLGREHKKYWYKRFFGKEKEEYKKAEEWMKKALELQEELGVSDTGLTAIFQRNLANTLIGLGEYDKALEHAKKSFEIRKAHLTKHPETVRILHLIGVIHEWRKDHEAALQSYEEAFAIEESLPEDNHSVVRKLLCDRLEVMCKKLKMKEKLEEYKPRLKRLRKIEDIQLSSKTFSNQESPDIPSPSLPDTDDDFLRVAEIPVSQTGGSYTISRMGVFLYLPPNAVAVPTLVTCTVLPKDSPLLSVAGADANLVSNIVELGPNDVDILQPINVAVMHSGPRKYLGYKTVVKALNQEKGVWEEIKELDDKSHLPKYCESHYIQVRICKLTTLAVVTRLITDRFQVTPKGCVVRSSVCDDVTIEFPEGAVDKTVEGTMKVIPVDVHYQEKEKGYLFPILSVDGFDGVHFQKLPTIKLSQPYPDDYPGSKICVLCLEDSKTPGETESQWKDITEEIRIEENEYFIKLHVTHFCWFTACKGVVNPLLTSSVFKSLWCFNCPRRVCFAAFDYKKPKEDSSDSFKLGLLCGRLEGYPELNPETADVEMRRNDKAYVEITEDFRKKEPDDPVFLEYLEDQVCRKSVYICKGEGIDKGGNEMLKVNFRGKNKELLCKLSYKAKDIPSWTHSIKVTTSFHLSDEEKRWLVVGICLNKTLLPPLRAFLKQQMDIHYDDLKTKHNIHNQSHATHLKKDGQTLNYKSMDKNKGKHKDSDFDFNVTSAVDLGKLYLEPKMAKFTGLDDTCDMSAVLNILSRASIFSIDVQDLAKNVKDDIRNPWGHCNFNDWTDEKFTSCFDLMKRLVQAFNLPAEDEKQTLDELGEWESQGTDLCKNASFEPNDLLKFIKVSKEKLARLKKVEQTNDALDSIWKALEKYEADILKKTRSSGTPS